jgi:uncharacterized protein involved in exopolysaccharide biosynthesis
MPAVIDAEILDAGTHLQSKNGQTRESEISLIDLLTVLLQRKRLILGATLTCALIAAVVALRLPISYKAQAVILAPQQQQSSLSALMAGGAMGGMGIASQLGLKSPADLYIGLLGSRSIADDIVNQFHLREVYKKKLASDARNALLGHVMFNSGKDSLIKIEATDEDAKLAANIANAFVDELYQQNSHLAVTDASQRRLFFEQRVASEKEALAIAETALKNTEQSTGLLAPGGQAQEMIRAGAQLRAEIMSREVRLQAMHAYATDENPQTQVLELEIKGYKDKLRGLEANGGAGSAFDLSAGRLPGASLEYVRKVRDLKYHETLFELMSKQYEAARIDEAKQPPLIQVVDRAVVPDRKAGPPRTQITVIGGALGFVLACAWALISRAIRNLSLVPEQAAQLRSLKSALRF